MNTAKTVLVSAVCALVMLASPLAGAAATVILKEKFNDVSALPGSVLVNQSAPAGLTWFQGGRGEFGAEAGPARSYIGASDLRTAQGAGHHRERPDHAATLALRRHRAVGLYVNIDTVKGVTTVQEPAGHLMLGVGLAVLSLLLPRSRT
jgi:hypothetical protein